MKFKSREDKSNWAMGGGGLLVGLGIGFFFLEASVLMFIGALILGLGFDVIITSIIYSLSNKKE